MKVGGMKIKKNPTLGAVIAYYILALGMFILQSPSIYFYLNKHETQGEVYKIESSVTHVKYLDMKGDEFITTTNEIYKRGTLEIGGTVNVHYRKDDPTDVHLPGFDGNRAYLVNFILVFMALGVVFIVHRDYLKGSTN